MEEWGHYRDIPWCNEILKHRARLTRDLESSKSDDYPYYYDEAAADRAVNFFHKHIKHTKGKQFNRKPFILSDWQEWDIIRPAFGWLNKKTGLRRFQKCLTVVGRKNGKSALGAGIGNLGAFGDKEPAAEVYSAATKEKQAKIVWSEAKAQIKKSKVLSKNVRILARELYCDRMDGSFFSFLGRDSDTEDGLNPYFGIIDEYHAHKDSSMLGVLETGTGARENWMIWIISTAGFNAGSPLKDEVTYARKVNNGTAQGDDYLAAIYEADDPEKWDEPEQWYKANPQLGLSLSLEYFEKKVNQAKDQPSKKSQFLVKHLNLWQSGDDQWMDMYKWGKSGAPFIISSFERKPVWLGIDIGRTKDLTCVMKGFRTFDENDRMHAYLDPTYFIPGEQSLQEKSRQDEADYVTWVQEGLIKLSDGPITRTDDIFDEVVEINKKFEVKEIAMDDWSGTDLYQRLIDAYFEVFMVPQTMKGMTLGIKRMYEMVLDRCLHHNNHPVLTWNVANAITRTDGNGNLKFMKDVSKHRIDGAVASSMVVERLLLSPRDEGTRIEIRSL